MIMITIMSQRVEGSEPLLRSNFIFEKITSTPTGVNPHLARFVYSYTPCDLIKALEVMNATLNAHRQLCDKKYTTYSYLDDKDIVKDKSKHFVLLQAKRNVIQARQDCKNLKQTLAEARTPELANELARLLGRNTMRETFAGLEMNNMIKTGLFLSNKQNADTIHKQVWLTEYKRNQTFRGESRNWQQLVETYWSYASNSRTNERIFTYHTEQNGPGVEVRTYRDDSTEESMILPVVCTRDLANPGRNAYELFRQQCVKDNEDMQIAYKTTKQLIREILPINLPQTIITQPTSIINSRARQARDNFEIFDEKEEIVFEKSWNDILNQENRTLQQMCTEQDSDRQTRGAPLVVASIAVKSLLAFTLESFVLPAFINLITKGQQQDINNGYLSHKEEYLNQKFDEAILNSEEASEAEAATFDYTTVIHSHHSLKNNFQIFQTFCSLAWKEMTSLIHARTSVSASKLISDRQYKSISEGIESKISPMRTEPTLKKTTVNLLYTSSVYYFVINIPIMDENSRAHIFKISVLPAIHQGMRWTPLIEHKHAAISVLGHKYTPLSEKEAKDCVSTALCRTESATYSREIPKCGITEYFTAPSNVYKPSPLCRYRTENNTDPVFIAKKNNVYYSTQDAISMNIYCRSEYYHSMPMQPIEIEGLGVYNTSWSCYSTYKDLITLRPIPHTAIHIRRQNAKAVNKYQLVVTNMQKLQEMERETEIVFQKRQSQWLIYVLLVAIASVTTLVIIITLCLKCYINPARVISVIRLAQKRKRTTVVNRKSSKNIIKNPPQEHSQIEEVIQKEDLNETQPLEKKETSLAIVEPQTARN
jgi:hypothetical protein